LIQTANALPAKVQRIIAGYASARAVWWWITMTEGYLALLLVILRPDMTINAAIATIHGHELTGLSKYHKGAAM